GAGPDAVEARELLGGEGDLERPEAPGQLLHRARPDDRRADGGVGEQPGERDVGGRRAELAAEALVRLELRAVPLDALLEAFARAAALLRLLERAAEQAARERAPRDHPDAVRAARGQHLQLDRARAQVVEALLGDEPEEVARRRPGVRLRDLPAGEVAAPHVHDLAGGDELLHRLPDLVPGCLPVDAVHLVEVDAVGLQAAEALVARAPDVIRGEPRVVRPLAHRGIDLGGEDDRLAAAAALREPAAYYLLGVVLAVAPAGDLVLVYAVVDGIARTGYAHDAVALGGERAEVHGPEAEAADAQPGAAEMDVLHDRSPSTPRWAAIWPLPSGCEAAERRPRQVSERS